MQVPQEIDQFYNEGYHAKEYSPAGTRPVTLYDHQRLGLRYLSINQKTRIQGPYEGRKGRRGKGTAG